MQFNLVLPWRSTRAPLYGLLGLSGCLALLAVDAQFLLIAAATLVSEDLTTIGVGALVGQGRIGFGRGAAACFVGIFAGDVLLYLAGRALGRAALQRAPLRWWIDEQAVARSSAWFTRRGAWAIFLSRFVPGLRLPTYFAAGVLRTSLRQFIAYFALACAVWTPLLVWLAARLGAAATERALFAQRYALLGAVLVGFAALAVIKFALRLTTWRGRRLLLGRWRRLARWEFWPLWLFYPPVVAYIAWLALKHRSLTLFTAVNPAMPASGFVGESKIAILRGLAGEGEFVAPAELISGALPRLARVEQAQQFIAARGLSFPVVLKPDVGQRGAGVTVIRSEEALEQFFAECHADAIIQEYVPGAEFGVFYYRLPGAARGHIFSITEKRMPVVIGDGRSSLEALVLNDDRAVCLAHIYARAQAARWLTVPAQGERVQLVELGTHCRGAIFLDGGRHKTAALAAAIDRISQKYEGFYFGRYDIRTPSVEHFRRGENFKVIELNGVTSESTNIYDPRYSLAAAYGILFRQWRLAFEIARRNRAHGVRAASVRELVRLLNSSPRSP